MDDVMESAKPAKREAADVLQEIEAKLATLDGIATSDAFCLGGLVREYGDLKAGESSSKILLSLLDAMTKPPKGDPKDAKPPWL